MANVTAYLFTWTDAATGRRRAELFSLDGAVELTERVRAVGRFGETGPALALTRAMIILADAGRHTQIVDNDYVFELCRIALPKERPGR